MKFNRNFQRFGYVSRNSSESFPVSNLNNQSLVAFGNITELFDKRRVNIIVSSEREQSYLQRFLNQEQAIQMQIQEAPIPKDPRAAKKYWENKISSTKKTIASHEKKTEFKEASKNEQAGFLDYMQKRIDSYKQNIKDLPIFSKLPKRKGEGFELWGERSFYGIPSHILEIKTDYWLIAGLALLAWKILPKMMKKKRRKRK